MEKPSNIQTEFYGFQSPLYTFFSQLEQDLLKSEQERASTDLKMKLCTIARKGCDRRDPIMFGIFADCLGLHPRIGGGSTEALYKHWCIQQGRLASDPSIKIPFEEIDMRSEGRAEEVELFRQRRGD